MARLDSEKILEAIFGTKATDNLILCKRNGKYYMRRQRRDNINPRERSPARQQALRNFSRARTLVSESGRGKGRWVNFVDREGRTRYIPEYYKVMSDLIKSMPITAPRQDRKKEYQNSLWEEFERSGNILIEFFGEVIYVVRNAIIRPSDLGPKLARPGRPEGTRPLQQVGATPQ